MRRRYGFVEIEVPKDIPITAFVAEDLPPGWDHPRDHTVSRPIGDAWYDSAGRSFFAFLPWLRRESSTCS